VTLKPRVRFNLAGAKVESRVVAEQLKADARFQSRLQGKGKPLTKPRPKA
jgi:hypothetical protein